MHTLKEKLDIAVIAVIGVSVLAVVIALLAGKPTSYNIIWKLVAAGILVACLNGSYISFSTAISGLDQDTAAKQNVQQRIFLFLAGVFVLAFVWFALWLIW
jgi:hypothetical protein